MSSIFSKEKVVRLCLYGKRGDKLCLEMTMIAYYWQRKLISKEKVEALLRGEDKVVRVSAPEDKRIYGVTYCYHGSSSLEYFASREARERGSRSVKYFGLNLLDHGKDANLSDSVCEGTLEKYDTIRDRWFASDLSDTTGFGLDEDEESSEGPEEEFVEEDEYLEGPDGERIDEPAPAGQPKNAATPPETPEQRKLRLANLEFSKNEITKSAANLSQGYVTDITGGRYSYEECLSVLDIEAHRLIEQASMLNRLRVFIGEVHKQSIPTSDAEIKALISVIPGVDDKKAGKIRQILDEAAQRKDADQTKDSDGDSSDQNDRTTGQQPQHGAKSDQKRAPKQRRAPKVSVKGSNLTQPQSAPASSIVTPLVVDDTPIDVPSIDPALATGSDEPVDTGAGATPAVAAAPSVPDTPVTSPVSALDFEDDPAEPDEPAEPSFTVQQLYDGLKGKYPADAEMFWVLYGDNPERTFTADAYDRVAAVGIHQLKKG